MPTQTADLLTVQEAAEILRVSPENIRRRVRTGALPACRLSQRAIRIRRADLESLATPTPVTPSALEAHIAAVVAKAPPLSPEQCARIASIMQHGGAVA